MLEEHQGWDLCLDEQYYKNTKAEIGVDKNNIIRISRLRSLFIRTIL